LCSDPRVGHHEADVPEQPQGNDPALDEEARGGVSGELPVGPHQERIDREVGDGNALLPPLRALRFRRFRHALSREAPKRRSDKRISLAGSTARGRGGRTRDDQNSICTPKLMKKIVSPESPNPTCGLNVRPTPDPSAIRAARPTSGA